MSKSTAQPLHPGEVLRKDFMEPVGLSANSLAKALGVTPSRVNDILLKRRGVTGGTALRLARYFGGEAIDWLVLQAKYDLRIAELVSGKDIELEVTPRIKLTSERSGR